MTSVRAGAALAQGSVPSRSASPGRVTPADLAAADGLGLRCVSRRLPRPTRGESVHTQALFLKTNRPRARPPPPASGRASGRGSPAGPPLSSWVAEGTTRGACRASRRAGWTPPRGRDRVLQGHPGLGVGSRRTGAGVAARRRPRARLHRQRGRRGTGVARAPAGSPSRASGARRGLGITLRERAPAFLACLGARSPSGSPLPTRWHRPGHRCPGHRLVGSGRRAGSPPRPGHRCPGHPNHAP